MPICEPESIDEGLFPSREEREFGGEVSAIAPPARHGHYLWVLFALLAVIGLAAVIRILVAGSAAAPIRIESLPFGFQAAQRQDHLLLSWNPAAKAVRNASAVTLSIHDGPESEDVALDLDTLRRGGIDYFPVFEDVSFRLTLHDAPGKTVSEQAHVIFRPE